MYFLSVLPLWVGSPPLTVLLAQWKLSVSSNWLLRRVDVYVRHTGCTSFLLSQFISPQCPFLSISLSPSFHFSLFIFSSFLQVTLSVIGFSGGNLPQGNWFTTPSERRKRRLTLLFCLVLAFRLLCLLHCIPCLLFFLVLFFWFDFSPPGFSLIFIYLTLPFLAHYSPSLSHTHWEHLLYSVKCFAHIFFSHLYC